MGRPHQPQNFEKSNLEKMLGSKGPFTVFAPTDKAFEELNVKKLSEEDLRLIILQHIVPQRLRHQDLSDNQVLNTKSGNQLEVFQTPDGFMVGGSSLLSRYSDNVAHNGVVHVMKNVIFPYKASNRKADSEETKLDDIEE